jgi:iron complex transport system substrate-binding protein
VCFGEFMNQQPQRIVCLSAEAADWLCRIGAWDKVVGVTSFFAAPPDAPPKPRVSGFSSGRIDDILQLNPDLAITFSDVQAALTAELMRNGIPVIATNQRSLSETESTLELLARAVDFESQAQPWLKKFRECLAPEPTPAEPVRVYFEEWPDPLISGIGWISEMIERAGAQDVFAQLRGQRSAKNRIVTSDQVCRANPETIFASWCGRPFQPNEVQARPGWDQIEAVRERRIFEIPPEDILQPGFRLVFGYERIKQHLKAVRQFAETASLPASTL